jgi:hypothetical protein
MNEKLYRMPRKREMVKKGKVGAITQSQSRCFDRFGLCNFPLG